MNTMPPARPMRLPHRRGSTHTGGSPTAVPYERADRGDDSGFCALDRFMWTTVTLLGIVSYTQ